MIKLLPCPFCGNESPEIERHGTYKQSTVISCGECGCRHESSDEGEHVGSSWNERAYPTAPTIKKSELESLLDKCGLNENDEDSEMLDAHFHIEHFGIDYRDWAGFPVEEYEAWKKKMGL